MDGLSVSHPDVGGAERTAPTPVLKSARERPVFERKGREAFLWEREPGSQPTSPRVYSWGADARAVSRFQQCRKSPQRLSGNGGAATRAPQAPRTESGYVSSAVFSYARAGRSPGVGRDLEREEAFGNAAITAEGGYSLVTTHYR